MRISQLAAKIEPTHKTERFTQRDCSAAMQPTRKFKWGPRVQQHPGALPCDAGGREQKNTVRSRRFHFSVFRAGGFVCKQFLWSFPHWLIIRSRACHIFADSALLGCDHPASRNRSDYLDARRYSRWNSDYRPARNKLLAENFASFLRRRLIHRGGARNAIPP